MALVELVLVTRKEGGAKSHLHVGPSTLGLTHQDGNHDADVLGVLPEHTAMGHFCKMCQSAKEHQKAQHLEHRSDLRGEKGPSQGQQEQGEPSARRQQCSGWATGKEKTGKVSINVFPVGFSAGCFTASHIWH